MSKSALTRDITGVNNPFYGKTHSDDTKEKIGKRDYTNQTGANHVNSKMQKIFVDGIIFDSRKSAAEYIGMSSNALYDYLRGLYKNEPKQFILKNIKTVYCLD